MIGITFFLKTILLALALAVTEIETRLQTLLVLTMLRISKFQTSRQRNTSHIIVKDLVNKGIWKPARIMHCPPILRRNIWRFWVGAEFAWHRYLRKSRHKNNKLLFHGKALAVEHQPELLFSQKAHYLNTSILKI